MTDVGLTHAHTHTHVAVKHTLFPKSIWTLKSPSKMTKCHIKYMLKKKYKILYARIAFNIFVVTIIYKYIFILETYISIQ